MLLVTAHEMQELDRTATREYGIPSVVLMENAGHNSFLFMEKILGKLAGKTVCFFIGPGNNGGDGLVVARKLHQAGGNPVLFFVKPAGELKGDAATNAAIVARLGITSFNLSSGTSQKEFTDIIIQQHADHPVVCMVDALFGTGLVREVTGIFAETITWINNLQARFSWTVLAIDLPSGLEADTGRVMGIAVTADLTVTYGFAKPAHFLHGGERIGRLEVVDIDIPREAVKQLKPAGSVLNTETISLPRRDVNSHKGTHGHLLVIAGSIGMTGAAILSCKAALRSGCGLVSVAVPHNLNQIFETALPEVMTIPLPGSTDSLSMEDYSKIMDAVAGKAAVVIGPGIGRYPKTTLLIETLYRKVTAPMVVDADALGILADDPDFPDRPGSPRILTPHPGEMSKLSGLTVERIQDDRIGAALNLSRKCYGTDTDIDGNSHRSIITVLKGPGTVIAASSGKWAINSSGNPGMASGGMGDVLAGLIGGLLAQWRHPPWEAACTGVYLHGLAADILADETGCGFTPSEVADRLPEAIQKVETRHALSLQHLLIKPDNKGEQQEMKQAKDIMTTETISATESMPVRELAKLLFDNKIGGVPVQDESGKVIGVVTESDLIDQNKKVHIPTVISFLDGFFFLESPGKMENDLKKMAGITAGDICSKKFVSVTPETPLDEVATLMAEKQVHTLPVLDGDHLVGVVGKTDIIRTIFTD